MAMLTTFAHARINGRAVPGVNPQALFTGAINVKAESRPATPDLLSIILFDAEGGVHAALSLHPDEASILANGFTRFASGKTPQVDACAVLKTLESLSSIIRRREPSTPEAHRATDEEYNTALLCAEFLIEQAKQAQHGGTRG
jgi:hypothetical protein